MDNMSLVRCFSLFPRYVIPAWGRVKVSELAFVYFGRSHTVDQAHWGQRFDFRCPWDAPVEIQTNHVVHFHLTLDLNITYIYFSPPQGKLETLRK